MHIMDVSFDKDGFNVIEYDPDADLTIQLPMCDGQFAELLTHTLTISPDVTLLDLFTAILKLSLDDIKFINKLYDGDVFDFAAEAIKPTLQKCDFDHIEVFRFHDVWLLEDKTNSLETGIAASGASSDDEHWSLREYDISALATIPIRVKPKFNITSTDCTQQHYTTSILVPDLDNELALNEFVSTILFEIGFCHSVKERSAKNEEIADSIQKGMEDVNAGRLLKSEDIHVVNDAEKLGKLDVVGELLHVDRENLSDREYSRVIINTLFSLSEQHFASTGHTPTIFGDLYPLPNLYK